MRMEYLHVCIYVFAYKYMHLYTNSSKKINIKGNEKKY